MTQCRTAINLLLWFHFTFTDTCYADGEASRGQKGPPAVFFYKLPDRVAIFPAKVEPGDPGGQSLLVLPHS